MYGIGLGGFATIYSTRWISNRFDYEKLRPFALKVVKNSFDNFIKELGNFCDIGYEPLVFTMLGYITGSRIQKLYSCLRLCRNKIFRKKSCKNISKGLEK